MANDLYDVMDLKALRCFWAMARHRSLTRAGIELGISEAAVSQRIKSLEAHLGTKLYEATIMRYPLVSTEEEADRSAIETIAIPEEFGGATTYGLILRRDKHLTTPLRGLLDLIGIDV